MKKITNYAESFWKKVSVKGPDECWEWRGKARNRLGYGVVRGPWVPELNRGRTMLSHRVAWELSNGPVPKGKMVCHHCDNPPCCNPNHLYVGTQKENMMDCVNRGRHNAVFGEQVPHAVLTNEIVKFCRKIYKPYKRGASADFLARVFKVSPTAMYLAVTGKSWTHVQT